MSQHSADVQVNPLEAAQSSQDLVHVQVRYLSLLVGAMKQSEVSASIARPAQAAADAPVQPQVQEAMLRLGTAKAMKDAVSLGDRGDLAGYAQADVLDYMCMYSLTCQISLHAAATFLLSCLFQLCCTTCILSPHCVSAYLLMLRVHAANRLHQGPQQRLCLKMPCNSILHACVQHALPWSSSAAVHILGNCHVSNQSLVLKVCPKSAQLASNVLLNWSSRPTCYQH